MSHEIIDFNQWESYGETAISIVTVSELLMGVHRADTEARKLRRSAFVEAIIREIPSIEFNMKSVRIHAELYAYLAHSGQLIGAHDLIIAATALAWGHALLTANEREFRRVPGLEVVSI